MQQPNGDEMAVAREEIGLKHSAKQDRIEHTGVVSHSTKDCSFRTRTAKSTGYFAFSSVSVSAGMISKISPTTP
jgi:hypothetical protein